MAATGPNPKQAVGAKLAAYLHKAHAVKVCMPHTLPSAAGLRALPTRGVLFTVGKVCICKAAIMLLCGPDFPRFILWNGRLGPPLTGGRVAAVQHKGAPLVQQADATSRGPPLAATMRGSVCWCSRAWGPGRVVRKGSCGGRRKGRRRWRLPSRQRRGVGGGVLHGNGLQQQGAHGAAGPGAGPIHHQRH